MARNWKRGWAVHRPLKKNVSLLGAALLIAHFGAGPLSVDEWLSNRPV